MSPVDREAITRARRRMQAEELLADERDREAALRDALEERISEADGPALDEQIFASLSPEEARLVRNGLTGVLDDETPPDEAFWGEEEEPEVDEESVQAELEEEIARLQAEVEACRARQQAYERYLQVLDA